MNRSLTPNSDPHSTSIKLVLWDIKRESGQLTSLDKKPLCHPSSAELLEAVKETLTHSFHA